ncbi:MAG TPA: hypothetical protein VNM24_14020 [Burkholderiales bacterium]|nr:hypothetical protein [Burkholderiales bacterium]
MKIERHAGRDHPAGPALPGVDRCSAVGGSRKKLCGFDVGLDRPIFLIAGSAAARSRGPEAVFGDATVKALLGPGARVRP